MPQRNAYHRRFSTAAAKSATGSVVNNIHSNGSIPAGSPTSRTNTAHSQTEGQRDLRWGGGNSTWAQSAGEGGGGATGGGGSGASRGRSGRCWSTARKSFGSRSQVMLLHQLIPWPREGRTAPIHQHDFQRAQLRQGTGQRRDLRPLVQNTRRPDWRRAWSGGRQGQKSLLGQVFEGQPCGHQRPTSTGTAPVHLLTEAPGQLATRTSRRHLLEFFKQWGRNRTSRHQQHGQNLNQGTPRVPRKNYGTCSAAGGERVAAGRERGSLQSHYYNGMLTAWTAAGEKGVLAAARIDIWLRMGLIRSIVGNWI